MAEDEYGFVLDKEQAPAVKPAPAPERPVVVPGGADFDAMKATLKQGVQVVVANQLFPTPAELADKMAAMAGLEDGDHVLEPSAGAGALMTAAVKACPGIALMAVEVNQLLADRLKTAWPDAFVTHEDFLAIGPADIGGQVDVCLMNPPFENGADIKHVRYALEFVKPGGRLVAIMAAGPRQRAFVEEVGEHWEDLPEGTFAPATQVRTMLVVIRKGGE